MKGFSKFKTKLKAKAKDLTKTKPSEHPNPAPTSGASVSVQAVHTTDDSDRVGASDQNVEGDTEAAHTVDNRLTAASPPATLPNLDESRIKEDIDSTRSDDSKSVPRSNCTALVVTHAVNRRYWAGTAERTPGRRDIYVDQRFSSTSTTSSNQESNEIADLWGRAYDLLRTQNEDLLTSYEEILASEVSGPMSGMSTWMGLSGQEREVAATKLIEKQTQLQNQTKWRLQIGSRTIEFQEQFNRIVKLVVFSKDIITSVVSPSPHAAIAWAGVCIILPLLLNPSSQSQLNVDGIEYISTLISQCAIRERTYRQNFELDSDRDHKADDLRVLEGLETAMTQVYVLILEFQARTICQLFRSKISRTVRDTFKTDDWKSLKENMKSANERCTAFTKTIDSERLRLGLTDLRRGLEEQFAILSQLIQDSQSKPYYETLRVLRTSDYVFNKDKNPSRVPGTCLWFLYHPKYKRWLETDSGLLWVSADPGCGKSVLARFLVDEEFGSKMTSSQKLCYFFFKDDEEVHRSANHALTAILHQLLLQDSNLLKYLSRSVGDGGNLSLNFDGLWDAFASCAGDTKIICVLDALDECEEKSRELLLKKIRGYFGTGQRNSQNLKIILTSRPWSSIGDGLFYQSDLDKDTIRLMGENDEETKQISYEIQCVVQARVLEFRDFRSYKGINDDAHILLQTRLDAISNRTYLWVALIFPELQRKAAESKRELLKIIDNLPLSVDEIYEKILDQSNDLTRARKLLHIVVVAVRPLTVEEMNIALAIQDADTSFDDIELTPPSSFAPVLRELCGLFVSIIGNRIYLAHQTAKDFLQKPPTVDNKSSTSSRWKHSLDPKESHKSIAWSCIRYLLLDNFEQGIFPRRDADLFETWDPPDPVMGCVPCFATRFGPYRTHRISHDDSFKSIPTSDRIVQKAIKQHPFLEYSAKHWFRHAKFSEDQDYFLQAMLQLWQINLPRGALWLAICNSMRNVARLPSALRRNWSPLAVHSSLGNTEAVKFLLSRTDGSTESRAEANISLQLAINKGHFDIVREILATNVGIVDTTFEDFSTPLSCAVAGIYPDIVQMLFQAGHKISTDGLLCEVLRDKFADWKFVGFSDKSIRPSLHSDIAEIVVLLLREGANINQLSVHGERPLTVAFQTLNFEGVRALLESDSGEYRGKDRIWNEQFAVHYSKLDMEERLDINAKNSQGKAPLHLIQRPDAFAPLHHEQIDFRLNEQLKIVKYLLAKGADPNIMSNTNHTPLHYAIAALQHELVEELLKHGADIHGRPPQKAPPLHRIIASTECKPPTGYKAAFKTPCNCQSTHAMLDLLLKYGANLDATTMDGKLRSTLHLAVYRGNWTLTDYLLDHGVNIEAMDRTGYTPLLTSVRYGRYLLAQKLLENGANINAQTTFGITPLHLAAHMGDEDMLRLLLRYHPNLNLRDGRLKTALHLTANSGDWLSTILLLGAGAKVDLYDEKSRTPLHSAIESCFLNTSWILLMAQSPTSAARGPNIGSTLDFAYFAKEQLEMLRSFALSDSEIEEPPHESSISEPSNPVISGVDHATADKNMPKEESKPESRDTLGARFSCGSVLPSFPRRTNEKLRKRPGTRTLHPKPTLWPPPTDYAGYELRTDYFIVRDDLSDASEDLDIVGDSSSIDEGSLASALSDDELVPSDTLSNSTDEWQSSVYTGRPPAGRRGALFSTSHRESDENSQGSGGADKGPLPQTSRGRSVSPPSTVHSSRLPSVIQSSRSSSITQSSSSRRSEEIDREISFRAITNSCMSLVRRVYHGLPMQDWEYRSRWPNELETSQVDFDKIISLLERDKQFVKASDEEPIIENRFILEDRLPEEDSESEKEDTAGNSKQKKDNPDDPNIWLPSSIIHPSREADLEMWETEQDWMWYY